MQAREEAREERQKQAKERLQNMERAKLIWTEVRFLSSSFDFERFCGCS
jgi:hypothetical protein